MTEFCPACGAPRDDGSPMCRSCGLDLRRYDAAAHLEGEYTRMLMRYVGRKSWLAVLLAVAAIVIGLVVRLTGWQPLVPTRIDALSCEVPGDCRAPLVPVPDGGGVYPDR